MSFYDHIRYSPGERLIIVGGPRTGKSTIARQLRSQGARTFCGDPKSLVKEPEPDVTYLPEGLAWTEGSEYVAENWFTLDGPWVMEGQIMARALRKCLRLYGPQAKPADRIIVLTRHHPQAEVSSGQASMHKSVMTVWDEMAEHFNSIAEYPYPRTPGYIEPWRDDKKPEENPRIPKAGIL